MVVDEIRLPSPAPCHGALYGRARRSRLTTSSRGECHASMPRSGDLDPQRSGRNRPVDLCRTSFTEHGRDDVAILVVVSKVAIVADAPQWRFDPALAGTRPRGSSADSSSARPSTVYHRRRAPLRGGARALGVIRELPASCARIPSRSSSRNGWTVSSCTCSTEVRGTSVRSCLPGRSFQRIRGGACS